jgi:hypothetical protein
METMVSKPFKNSMKLNNGNGELYSLSEEDITFLLE